MRDGVPPRAVCWFAFFTLSVFGGPSAHADNFTIYGQFAEAVEYYRGSHGLDFEAINNWGSWIGFRGEESLSETTKVLFRWEDAFRPELGNERACGRLCWLGLRGEFGFLKIGRLLPIYDDVSLPWYYIQAPGGHNPLALWANCGGTAGIPDGCFDAYMDHSIRFDTNSYNGFTASATVSTPASPRTVESKIWSVGGEYRRGNLYFGAAHQWNDRVRSGGAEDEATTVSTDVVLGSLHMGAGVERLIYRQAAGGDLHRNYAGAMLRYVIGVHTVWLNYGIAGSGAGTVAPGTAINAVQNLPRSGAVMWSVGYEYKFSRSFSLYTYYNEINNDDNGVYNVSLHPFPFLTRGEKIGDIAIALVKRF